MGALHPERVLIGKSPFRGPVQEREAVRELLQFSASILLTSRLLLPLRQREGSGHVPLPPRVIVTTGGTQSNPICRRGWSGRGWMERNGDSGGGDGRPGGRGRLTKHRV